MVLVRLAAVLLAAATLFAAAPARSSAEGEPPTQVGRVSFVSGKVGFETAGAWIPAAVNFPIAERQALRTEGDARAELRIGAMTVMLSGDTEVEIARLDGTVAELVVPHGRVGVELRVLPKDRSVEFDIPRGGIWLVDAGRYDIEAGAAGQPARVAAFSGKARVVAGPRETELGASEAVTLAGTDSAVATAAAAPDAFVEWCRTRGSDEAQLAAPLHVSRDMAGYDALDANGAWETTADYGAVWYPNLPAAEWAPFRFGHWVRLEPWGWTWIDDRPWAFAVSHYGRWVHTPGADGQPARWGWVPGKFVAEPAFVPAVVAFLGTDGVGLSYADGYGPAMAWFPLAPGEVYWPRSRRDIAFIRRLNEGAVDDVNLIAIGPDGAIPDGVGLERLANRAFAAAMPRAAFLAGKPVAAALVEVPERRLLHAPLLLGSLPQPAPPRPAVAVLRPSTPPPAATVAARLARIVRHAAARPALRKPAPLLAVRPHAPATAIHPTSRRAHFAAGRAAWR